jgi:hypothetical protein
MGASMDLFDRDVDRLLAGLREIPTPLGMARRLMENLLLMQHANGKPEGCRAGWRRS